MNKVCSKCKKEKDIISFPKKKGYRDSIYCWCYECVRRSKTKTEEQKQLTINILSEKRSVNVLSNEDASYLAGFLDGEGHIGINKTHSNTSRRKVNHTIRIKITNTFPGIMDWISCTVGHGSVSKQKIYVSGHKQSWEWCISGFRAIDLLRQLHPYLKVKKLQAEVAFQYYGTFQPGSSKVSDDVIQIRDYLIGNIRKLNRSK
jgi:hypothetical protein